MTIDDFKGHAERLLATLVEWATSPQFYAQIGAIIVAVSIATFLARQIRTKLPFFSTEPWPGPLLKVRQAIYASRDLLFAIINVLALAIAAQVCDATVGTSWLVRIAQSVSVVNVLYTAISRYVSHPLLRAAGLYVGIPVAALQVFGWFDDAVAWLDQLSFHAGNIRLSVLALIKAGLFGSLLFWLGRLSNDAGQKVIRKQEALDLPTRELFAKLFQIAVFCAAFVLLLQLLGLDLTALAIFGGALGVGIGFGLQQIAANFISGIIILLERSLKVGDYIEMDGGKAGILKELNMRSTTLETFDGKEILVPNEKLITTSFTNWTKSDPTQRYEVVFPVSADADAKLVKGLVEAVVVTHPRVLKTPHLPECELRAIADKSLSFAVTFWVDGLDGGPNKVPAEVRLLVWETLRLNGLLMRP
jgi:small-conductance mechanosensitive channel